MIATERPRLLTREEAAEYLGIKPGTLSVWACTGRYPIPVIKVGRAVRYDRKALDVFLAARTVTPCAVDA